ncbi:MAG: hypothetical protein ABR568_03150 [Pyrinomonadaceae bacterium]
MKALKVIQVRAQQYSDANLDFADALIVAMAERLNITRLLSMKRVNC